MNRLVIESVEGRITLGIVTFVAIMILIGWVAINEPSRMADFEEQHTGRSVERGAELYAANCSTCHQPNGRGQAGRAPGLNSPHLFGYNFVEGVNSEIAILQRNINDLQARVTELEREREMLFEELSGDISAEREAEINTRLGEIDDQLNPETEDSLSARIAQMEEDLEPLLVERDNQLAELEPAFLANYLPDLAAKRQAVEAGDEEPIALTNYIAEDSSRLAQVQWGGDVRSYLKTTLIHGRPGSSDVWGGSAMAAWAQTAGGPLRDDQIDDLVAYIMNWDKGDDWTTDDLLQVAQFARVKADAAQVAAAGVDMDPASAPIGTNVENILVSLEGLEGDPERGQQLYEGAAQTNTLPGAVLGCSACHYGGAVGPAAEGTWARTQNERLPDLDGDYTVEQYLVESIVRPNDYVVEGYASGAMLQTYGEQMTAQDMADVLAFLESQG